MEVYSSVEIQNICKASAHRTNQGAEASRKRSDMAMALSRHALGVYHSLFGGEEAKRKDVAEERSEL